MAFLDMKGPFILDAAEIALRVANPSPGTFALGHRTDVYTFVVRYVGRSDRDLAGRLRAWIESPYPTFMYSYADGAREAFEKECRIYHDFQGWIGRLDNDRHPERPDAENWQCPLCNFFSRHRTWS